MICYFHKNTAAYVEKMVRCRSKTDRKMVGWRSETIEGIEKWLDAGCKHSSLAPDCRVPYSCFVGTRIQYNTDSVLCCIRIVTRHVKGVVRKRSIRKAAKWRQATVVENPSRVSKNGRMEVEVV